MFNRFSTGGLDNADDWASLREALDPGVPDRQGGLEHSGHLLGVLNAFRDVGAVYYIHEHVYVDRDFVHAYATFYHRTHRVQPKHSSRIHFFRQNLSAVDDYVAEDRAIALEENERDYLGFIVLRPVRHAPVSWALVSADALMSADDIPSERGDVLIRATYEVHLLGAQLKVAGVPVSEQDSRTGSCAQSSIWSAARHLHKRYGEPWRSVVDITNAALTPTDAEIATQLPHGSARLGKDAMVRAMKNLGIQPLVYSREIDQPWYEPPHRIVARYLDSGIPVIVGLERSDELGRDDQHAVLAVGLAGHRRVDDLGAGPEDEREFGSGLGPATYDSATHLLVNDDQSGPYKRLSIRPTAAQATGDWLLSEATFILPAVPDGVFMRPENAETIARDRVRMMIANRDGYAHLPVETEADDGPREANVGDTPDEPPDGASDMPGPYAQDEDATDAADADDRAAIHDAMAAERKAAMMKFDAIADGLVTRTYLTPGWKYVERMVRNEGPELLKQVVSSMIFAKYVYVVEFGFREEMGLPEAADRRIRGHVVVDPTANPYDEPPITHVPGLLLFAVQQPEGLTNDEQLTICLLDDDGPYRPKIRGRRDHYA